VTSESWRQPGNRCYTHRLAWRQLANIF
ncbi:uncharacterized protein METZ01_LOCUS382990, partial [marine metagenome]